MNTMNPDQVRAAVRAKGTKFATVTFVKKDGSLRTINGHFRAVKHIVGSDRGQAHSEAMQAKGLVPIYSLKDRGWRSFSADRVQEIR
jgi:hypothetical protein